MSPAGIGQALICQLDDGPTIMRPKQRFRMRAHDVKHIGGR